MKKSEFNNNHKDKYDKFKTLLSIFFFQAQEIPRWNINETKSSLYAHGGMQKWAGNY